MARKTFVVGHKNPDTDCICATVALAHLLRVQGEEEVIAARQGEMRPETQWVLERFGVEAPVLLQDVRLRVEDAMTRQPVTVEPRTPLWEVGQTLHERGIRAVPVVDADRRFLGLISVEELARSLFEGWDQSALDQVALDAESVVRTLDGRVVVEGDRPLRERVLVGAMDTRTMEQWLAPGITLVVGDRKDAQRLALERGAGALIVTGNLPVDPEVEALARAKGAWIISVPHHTFRAVRLLELSIPASQIMLQDVLTIAPDETLDEARELLTRQRTLPVLDEAGTLVGVLSRSDLLRPRGHRVYLVDHNERSQTVEGLEEAELVGIIDHHRIGDIQTPAPAFFRNETVGATCTILATLYQEQEVEVPLPIAGVMLAGIISDTVLFRSPTSTPRDRAAAARLAERAGVDPEDLAEEFFAISSDLSGRSDQDILLGDFKEFVMGDARFGVGYLETLNRASVGRRKAGILKEMDRLRQERTYASVLFMVVDLHHGETEVWVRGHEVAVARALGAEPGRDGDILLPGIRSRKKDVVPALSQVAARLRA
ncbi:MAG: putative manganese-dependent inorganic diphosphatase [Anaerolineae bacterium]|nr:putative manganese-dependent inorganic diphosphatase [Anaerolineae bacterium]